MECTNKLKQMGLALHNHHDAFQRFPNSSYSLTLGAQTKASATDSDNGRVRVSCIPSFYPYMEIQALYDSIKQCTASGVDNSCVWIWDKNNTGLIAGSTAAGTAGSVKIGIQPVSALWCPSDSEVRTIIKPDGTGEMARNNYGPIMGDLLIDSGINDVKRCIFRRGDVASADFSSVTDGTSNTIVLAERAAVFDFSKKSKIIGGVMIVSGLSKTSKPSLCTSNIIGGNLMETTAITSTDNMARMWSRRFYDGRMPVLCLVTVLPPNSPTCGAGEMWDTVSSIGTVSSYHTGGANACLCDGSVRFVSSTIDAGDPNRAPTAQETWSNYTGESLWGVWGALGSVNGGENKTL